MFYYFIFRQFFTNGPGEMAAGIIVSFMNVGVVDALPSEGN